MPTDIPEDPADDSHAPFIFERNEPIDSGVLSDMDNTTTSQGSDSPRPTIDSRETDTTHQDEDFRTPTLGGETDVIGDSAIYATPDPEVDANTMATGEMDTVGDSPAAAIDSLEGVPTVTFDYDDYYGFPETNTPGPVVAEERPPTAPVHKDRTGLMFLGALAAGVLGAVITVGVFAATGSLSNETEPAPTTVATAAPAVTTVEPQVTTQIINDVGSSVNPSAVALKVVPSIVTVNVFDQGDGTTPVNTGSGSGVVMTADGYIITNNHVIENSTDLTVTFEDGRTYDAELIGADPLTDIAVLRISADNLVPIEFGSSDDLVLGDPVVAVGNPLGQDGGSSVSVGITSAFDRRVDFGDGSALHGMIQTDAAINSGSSGGALVNSEGRLVGITSAIGVSQAGPEGIGYAIPVELVDRITAEIIETGDVQHPFLGVTVDTFLEEAPDGATTPSGSDIQSIEGTDSAAGLAGLEVGDVVIRIGDKEILDQTDLILAIRLYRIGDVVEFEVLRGTESMTFDVVMGQRPEEFGG